MQGVPKKYIKLLQCNIFCKASLHCPIDPSVKYLPTIGVAVLIQLSPVHFSVLHCTAMYWAGPGSCRWEVCTAQRISTASTASGTSASRKTAPVEDGGLVSYVGHAAPISSNESWHRYADTNQPAPNYSQTGIGWKILTL